MVVPTISTSKPQSPSPTNGLAAQPPSTGLDHLVEAATALTQLVRTGNSPKVDQTARSNQISDDEENKTQESSGASTNNISAASSNGTKSTASLTQMPSIGAPVTMPGMTGVASHSTVSPSMGMVTAFKATENTKEIFPRRLLRILADNTISDIITWLPHGRAFVILKTDELAETVLPKYFPESCSNANSKANSTKSTKCKYPSFTRKLNRWGFRQVTRGPDSGAFHHKFFIREEPDLCLKMVCQRTIKRSKGDKGVKKHSQLKPAPQILGPYSAVLRQQPLDQQIQSNNYNVSNETYNTLMEVSESDSSTNNPRDITAAFIKNVNNMLQRRDEDQSTIISNTRSSCTSPAPNTNQLSSSVASLLSSTNIVAPQPGNPNYSPSSASQMVRTVSTTSSIPPGSSLNTNLIFSNYANNGAQLDPRTLLQHNFATNAYNNANANISQKAPAPVSTNNSASSNMSAMSSVNQLSQASTMPNFITLVDAKAQSGNHHGQQQHVHHNHTHHQPVVANTTQLPHSSNFNAPMVPVANLATANATNNSNMTNLSSINGGSTNFAAAQQLQLQQQQRPQQTEAEMRVANAKNMLYKAFLEALG